MCDLPSHVLHIATQKPNSASKHSLWAKSCLFTTRARKNLEHAAGSGTPLLVTTPGIGVTGEYQSNVVIKVDGGPTSIGQSEQNFVCAGAPTQTQKRMEVIFFGCECQTRAGSIRKHSVLETLTITVDEGHTTERKNITSTKQIQKNNWWRHNHDTSQHRTTPRSQNREKLRLHVSRDLTTCHTTGSMPMELRKACCTCPRS